MNYPLHPEIIQPTENFLVSPDFYDRDEIVIDMFLDTKRLGSEKTSIMYESVLKDFLKYVGKPIRLINHKDILDYIEYLSTEQPGRKKLKASTQNMKLSVVKSFYRYLMQLGYVKLNPAEPIPIKKRNRQAFSRYLSEDDLKRVFEVVKSRRKVEQIMLFFFSTTGCRVSEMCRVRWKDIFVTPDGIVCVNVTGKGDKDRIRKIIPSLWAMIVDYRQEEGLSFQIDSTDVSPMIMTAAGNPYAPGTVWSIIKGIVNEAGLNSAISPHWFRHTFATHAAASGVDVWQLKDEMGHANITTTQDYVHIAQGMKNTSVDQIAYVSEIEKMLQDE